MTPTASSPTVLTCSSPEQFLASIPLMLGYAPRDSIVVTLFEGARAHSAARFDIPQPDCPLESTTIDDAVVGLVRQVPDVESIAIVVYTSDAFAVSAGTPHALLAMWLERAVELAGIPVRELACVASDGWALYRSAPSQTPRPLSEIREHQRALAFATPACRAPESLEAMSALPETDPSLCSAIEEHLRTHEPIDLAQSDAVSFTRLVNRCWSLMSQGVETDSAHLAATFILLSQEVQTWLIPVFLISADAGKEPPNLREDTAEAFLALLHNPVFTPPSGGEVISRRLRMFSSERLNQQRLRTVINVLLKLSAHTPVRLRSGVLTLASWSWWMGAMGTPASILLDEARRLDPVHPTVRTLEALMEQGAPLWVFRRKEH